MVINRNILFKIQKLYITYSVDNENRLVLQLAGKLRSSLPIMNDSGRFYYNMITNTKSQLKRFVIFYSLYLQ